MDNNSDFNSITEEQQLAYALLQDKPKTIEQFVRLWNKTTDEKRDITELEGTNKNVRDFAIKFDGFDKEWFDSDELIVESIAQYNEVQLLMAEIEKIKVEIKELTSNQNAALLKFSELKHN